jgi:hypothetical protein
MARLLPVEGMLFSGRIGNAVFCCRANGTAYVRQWVRPKDPRTLAQVKRRGKFQEAIDAWKKLPDAEKKKFNDRARFMRRLGYHLFLSEFMSGPIK